MNEILLFDVAKTDVLAGSTAGGRMHKALWELAKVMPPGLVALSFKGIDVATSSYMREAILNFRTQVRQERNGLYPVLVELNADVEEELVNLLDQVGEAFWIFDFKKNAVISYRLIGRIDPKLKETLDLIDAGRGHDAATLWKDTNSKDSIGVTAWNNRLASLAKQGLVFETKTGKQKYFYPLYANRS